MMNKNSHNSQDGNAIIIIFVGIALFAALTLAFNNSSRTSSNFIGDTSADSYAGQIIQLINDSRSATKKLLLRNCDANKISFEGAQGGFDYSPIGTVPEKCEMFNDNGGGINYSQPPPLSLNNNFSSNVGYGHTIYVTNNNISGSEIDGQSSEAVHVFIPYITNDVCAEINNKLYDSKTVPIDSNGNITLTAMRSGTVLPTGNVIDCESTHLNGSECSQSIGCFGIQGISGSNPTNLAFGILMRD